VIGGRVRQADRIRAFVIARYIEPARGPASSKVSIRAGDVHRELGLNNAMPAVCSALGSNKFVLQSGATPISRSGPSNGANAFFEFEVTPLGSRQARSRVTEAEPPSTSSRSSRKFRGHLTKGPDLGDALVLISCVKSKRPQPTEARDLYVSPLFTMARDLTEAHGAEFRILSARYGLVEPTAKIAPYEYSLNQLGRGARREWAQNVLAQLLPLAKKKGRVVFFAGERYREYLIDPLRSAGVDIEIPMEGLRLGEQLSWLRLQL
jgi:hypothetical protein